MSEAIKPSPAAPEAPGAASASAEAPAAPDALSPATEPRCKCGAGPDPEQPWRCTRKHPFTGHGGKLSTKTGLHVQGPPQPVDVSSEAARASVILKVFESTARHAVRLAEAADRHTLRPRDGAALMQALDRLVAIEPQVRALAPAADAPQDAGASNAEVMRRIARILANEPDLFGEFLTELITIDRDACGPLRQQMALTLAHFGREGVPKFRGRRSDDDEVDL